ncbi:MAG: type II toxin-antitoxin system HicB family antitoxin [Chloroflexi bacterium]|nr:type II toxin-antitoxin system HicB family antitoxin [Chloroflexota bacterium]
MRRDLTISVVQDGDLFVSHCVDLDIASQGQTSKEAIENVKEAVTLFLEEASEAEISARFDQCGFIEQVSFEIA